MQISPAELIAIEARLARNRKRPPEANVVDACERESDLHAQILAECKRRGWLAFHGSMAHRALRTIGEPDFTVLADGGRVFFLECKTASGKLSNEQLGLAMMARRLGHEVHVVRSLAAFLEIVS